jgi:ABC-2 type transport system ATP-binding protein
LLFAEEMSTLTARFREITLTLPPPSANAPPATLIKTGVVPESWLVLEQTSTAARFVHTHADSEDLPAQVASVFPTSEPLHIQAVPMTLRGIFLALAKSGRTPAIPSQA